MSALARLIDGVREAVVTLAHEGGHLASNRDFERLAALVYETTGGDHAVEITTGLLWTREAIIESAAPRVRVGLRGWLDGDEVEAEVTVRLPVPPGVARQRNDD